MTKKHFIALADAIRNFNAIQEEYPQEYSRPFTYSQLDALASFCQQQNPAFNRERWLAYIKGEVGAHGGRTSDGNKV